MKIPHIILLFLGVLLLCTCKKTDYSNNSTTTQPVFYFNGTINNASVNIQAGVNNYYMATSYAKDANGIYNYTGEFMATGCSSTCPNSLELFFKDNSQAPAMNTTHIDSVIAPRYFSFSTPAGGASAYYVHFTDIFNETTVSYRWNFGDGQTGSGNNPYHVYYHPGIYTVSLNAKSNGCSSDDTNNIVVGQVGNAFVAPFSNTTWTVTAHGDSTSFQAAVPTGVEPYTCVWNFGDGTSVTTGNPVSHTFVYPNVYLVSVICTDITGYTDKQSMNIITPGTTGCAVGFYEGPQTALTNPLNLDDVGVKWYDNAGTLWTSENNNQHTNSMFNVTSVADYMSNAAGQATKIIGAQISCELYNSLGDSIPITGSAVFSVAHF